MSADCLFFGGRVRTDQLWDEGVGAGGGQLGSNARARRSLAVASRARLLSLPWGRGIKLRMTEVGRGRRSGTVRRRRSLGSTVAGKTRYGGLLEKYSRTQHLLWFGDSITMSESPPPSRYPIIDRLPHAVCLGLS
jgi:hypothetical protein